MVFPLPSWAFLLQGPLRVFPLGKYALYSMEIRYPSPAFKAQTTLPSWVPVVGGRWGLQETQARVGMKAKTDGSGSGKLYGQTGIDLGSSGGRSKSVAGFAEGKAKVRLVPGVGLDVAQASFSLGIKGTVKDKTGPADMFPGLKAAESWWFVGWVIKKFNSLITLSTALEPKVALTLIWKAVKEELVFDRGEGTGSVKIEATATMKLWESLKASIYGGGIPRLVFQAPAAPSYLKEIGMKLYFGLRLNIWKWEERFQRGINCRYPPGNCSSSLLQVLSQDSANWQLMPRDYITDGYAAFTANQSAARLRRKLQAPEISEETEIVRNVFPLADPALAIRDDGQQLLLWVHDDPAKPNGQGEEINFIHWNGTTWSPPASITNDSRQDFAPQVAFDGSGQAVAIWERSKIVHPVTPTLDITFTQSMEIAHSVWDGTGWSAPAYLTRNDAMDYGPRLARAQNGTLMALWRTNSGETLIGDENNPDALTYAIWDGATWSTPTIAVADLAGVLGVSLAYSGPEAAIVLSRDTDGDLTTSGDSELYYAEFDGAKWAVLNQLTDDDTADAAPQAVYDRAGQADVVWLREGELVFLDGGWSALPTALWPDGGMDFANYSIAEDPEDNLALVYQGLSDDGADVYYTVYDDTNRLWGLPLRMTKDLPLDDYLDPVFGNDGTLWVAYTKVETLFEDREVLIDGERVMVESVPGPGRSDLYLLRHTLAPDLAISAADISLSVPNPAAGDTVVISATVHSDGDLAVAGGKLRFYDGAPGFGGLLIGETVELTSPLQAGISETVSVEWTVPLEYVSHDIHLLLDPFLEVQESDELNNLAHITTVLPDLSVAGTYAEYISPDTIGITTTIANAGTIPAENVRLEWHQGSITGTLLGTATVSTVHTGDSQDVSMTWTVSQADEGIHVVHAVVDPAGSITEADEQNNTDFCAADVLPDLMLSGSYLKVGIGEDSPDPVAITLSLSNTGVASARDVLVRVVHGSPFGNSGAVLYQTTVEALDAGESVQLSAEVSVPVRDDVYAIADPEWAIDEIYEGNNLALLVDFPPRMYLPLVLDQGQ